MPEIPCPFVFHRGGSHPLKTDRAGTVFLFCDFAKSNVWFRSEGAQNWLNGNGGAAPSPPLRGGPRSRENPENVVESYGPAVEDGDEQQWPRDLPAQPNPAIPVLGRCEECGTPILVLDLEACSACKAPIEWSVD